MAYNFPDAPTNGDIAQTAGQRFEWVAASSRWKHSGAALLNGASGVVVPGTNTWSDASSSPTTLTSTDCVEISLDNVTFSVGTISVSTGTTFYTRWNTGATCDDPTNNLGATITGTITDNSNGATQTYSKVVAALPWATTPTAPTIADGVTTSAFTYGEAAGNASSTGCIEFDVNGSGTFSQGPTAVTTGDAILTRWIYTAGSGTCGDSAHNTTIVGSFQSDGGQVENFSILIDKVADAFTFSPATSIEPPSVVTNTTPSFTLAGVTAPTSIWAALSTTSGGVAPTTAEFSTDGGTTYTAFAAAPGTDYINPGVTVQVRFTTGDTVGATDTLTVSVGPDIANKEDGTYTVTISKPPFANVTNFPTVADGVTTASTTWANGTVNISATGCIEYSVDGGTTYAQASISITDGTTLLTRWKAGTGVGTTCSDAPHGTTITGSIESATNADNASLLVDRQPDAFDFVDKTGVAVSTATTSNTVTLAGTNAASYLQWTPDATNPLTTVQASINGGAYTTVPAVGTYTLEVPAGATVTVQGTTGSTSTIGYGGTFTIGDSVDNTTDLLTVTTSAATPTITPPTISTPSNNAVDVAQTAVITTSTYTPLNGAGTHNCTDWELFKGGYPLTSTSTITTVNLGVVGNHTELRYKDSDSFEPNTALAQDEVYGKIPQDNAISQNSASGTYPLFEWADALTIDGFDDWYIPAINELEVLYRNFKPTTDSNDASYGTNPNAVPSTGTYGTSTPAQTTDPLFQESGGGTEAFLTTAPRSGYISATENSWSNRQAMYVDFKTGLQSSADKDQWPNYARAIRRVPIAEYTAAGSPNIGDYYAGGFYAGQYSTTANNTADYALILAPNYLGTYGGGNAAVLASFDIAGADADGFKIGMKINGGTSGSSGIITAVSGTAITYMGQTFVTGETISVDPSSYTTEESVVCDTVNLTSWTPSSSLENSTKYYVRAQYHSNDPLASGFGPIGEFTVVRGLLPGDPLGGGYYGGQIKINLVIYNLIVAPTVDVNTGLFGQYGGIPAQTGLQYHSATTGQWFNGSNANEDETYGGLATVEGAAGDSRLEVFNWVVEDVTGPNAGVFDATNATGTGIGGYNDWYVPARWEMSLLYVNLKPTTGDNNGPSANIYAVPPTPDSSNDSSPFSSTVTVQYPVQTTAALFQSGGDQAFAEGEHWCSNESDRAGSYAYADTVDFSDGIRREELKYDDDKYIRCIRRYPA